MLPPAHASPPRVRAWPTKELEKTMKKSGLLLLLIAAMPAAYANDFPTTDRVEYVLECMKDNGGKHEYLYKCSCVVDHIAKTLPYDEYVELSTAQRNQGLGGERGAEFRDPDSVKQMVKKYKTIRSDAKQACFIQ